MLHEHIIVESRRGQVVGVGRGSATAWHGASGGPEGVETSTGGYGTSETHIKVDNICKIVIYQSATKWQSIVDSPSMVTGMETLRSEGNP